MRTKGGNEIMKRKLLAVMMAVCMTASFAGGTATVFAAQEESTAKDEVIVTMPTTSEPPVIFSSLSHFLLLFSFMHNAVSINIFRICFYLLCSVKTSLPGGYRAMKKMQDLCDI